MEAVVMATRGVLVPERAYREAAVEAAGGSLRDAGVDPELFGEAARERLERHGLESFISRTLHDLGLTVGAPALRQAALRAATAHPDLRPSARLQATLRYLSSAVQLAFLDREPSLQSEHVIRALGLCGLTPHHVSTERFGHIARPPRGFAFRWLTQRLGTAPEHTLYVAADAAMLRAAEEAGWCTVPAAEHRAGDLEWLVDYVESAREASL